MKIYNELITDIETGAVISEDSYEYDGPIAGCYWAAVAVAGVALISAGASVYSAEQNKKQQEKARRLAIEQAAQQKRMQEKQQKANEEMSNKADKKFANTNSIMSAAEQAAKGGISGTMLTGPQGVDVSGSLGKSTLLGS